MYFSFISFALIITLIKSNIGSFWLIHSCHNPPLKGSQNRSLSQAGIWRQELKKSWRNGVYWLVHHGLLIQPRLTCPWTYIPTVGWAISNQSLIKKMINAPPTWLPVNLIQIFSQLKFPSSQKYVLAVSNRQKTHHTIDALSKWHTNTSLLNHKKDKI